MNTDLSPLEQGISASQVEGDSPEAEAERKRYLQEEQQISRWWAILDNAREFDSNIRKGYARDRRYARGDSGFDVSVPLIGTAIDTMVTFIYAKDPSVDCVPAAMVEAPKEPAPVPPVQPPGLAQLAQDPTQALAVPGAAEAVAQGGIEGGLQVVGAQMAEQQAQFEQANAEYQAQMMAWTAEQEARKQLKRERNLYAQTLEIVITKLWKKAGMKRRARKAVRSALTTGIGWMKASWQERSQRDPHVQAQINDLQTLLTRIVREEQALADGERAGREESSRAEIQQQMTALQEKLFVTVSRGFCLDFVPCQNMQVPVSVDIMDYRDGPWLAEYFYVTIADAIVMFPEIPQEKIRCAQRFARRKPDETRQAPENPITTNEADEFISNSAVSANAALSDDDFIQGVEIWSIDDGTVYTTIRGVKCWPKPPAPPNVKSPRFYPYFALAFIEEDGERSPASMPSRSWKLENEYNGRRTALKLTRQRNIPGILFDATNLSEEQVNKIQSGVYQEWIPIQPIRPGEPITNSIAPKPAVAVDPSLFDTSPILRDFERVWGTQEALQGSVEADKTATEAEIQQTGFQSRTGQMRDAEEDWLSDQAQYTAVVLVQTLEPADVQLLAGPDAVWPTLDTPEELETLINIDIKAGSTGKPNTRLEREAWAAVAPMLQQSAKEIGMMRNSSPSEVADKLEAIQGETMRIAGNGDGDTTKFIPQTEGTAPPAMAGQPPSPGAVNGPEQPIA